MQALVPFLAVAVLAAGCAGHHRHDGPSARAHLDATRGNTTSGHVMFHQAGDAVMVHARITGLKANQEHGFHVHEKGDCSSGDGMSTGGHFNPLGKGHGHHAGADKHAGDLPSLKADGAGKVDVKFTVKGISIGSGATDIVGKGLIVHAQPDDWTTQPTGNAGARIACAVIAAGR